MTNLQKLPIAGKVDTCPHCGYTDGFHVSFHQKSDIIRIILICPNCHYHYDPSWNITQSNEG